MPGLSVILGSNLLSANLLSKSYQELKTEKEGFDIHGLLFLDDIAIGISTYDGYPYYTFEDEVQLMVYEGLIYDGTESEIYSALTEISQKLRTDVDYKSAVTRFIERFDGDYIVLIFLKKEKKLIIFNDRWGRLPAFFFQNRLMFGFSRELKFLFHWIPAIEFNHFAIAEFLMLGYVLGEKTVVEGVRPMPPASILQLRRTGNEIDFVENVLLPIRLDTVDLGLTRRQILDTSVGIYQRVLSARLTKLHEKGYGILADVSAGFDTRAVFVGLCNECSQFVGITDVHVDSDQSFIALQLARLFARDLLVCVTRNPVDDLSAMRNVTYLEDMVQNCRIALRDQLTDAERCRISFMRPVARFMGMGGGDFMRRPYRAKRPYRTLADSLVRGDYNAMHGIPPSHTYLMLRLDENEFRESLDCELRRFPEQDDEGKIRHLYFEYYNKSVNGGENRHRMFSWTVTPLWAKDFLSFEALNLPMKHVGVRLHIDFMRSLDRRSLMVPIHKSHFRLDSPLSRIFYDTKLGLERFLQYNTYSFRAYMWITTLLWRLRVKSGPKYERLLEEASQLSDRVAARLNCIDREMVKRFLKSSPRPKQVYQLLTVLFYLDEIERRFGSKVIRCNRSAAIQC